LTRSVADGQNVPCHGTEAAASGEAGQAP
jgi:hypothetical protein